MAKREVCIWYNETSGMKRAFDAGLLAHKWLDEYCFNGGRGCVRKQRFEKDGYVSPDYVLPDGTSDPGLREWVRGR